jgi:phosphatidylethanolamine-binding protein (PEBP) family uncharacterized protein
MRRTLAAAVFAPLIMALALDGCASSNPSATTAAAAKINIPFRSVAFSNGSIPARYTCDGQDVSPPLEWGAVPAGVGALAIFTLGFKLDPGTHREQLSVEWALSGVNPALHRLAAGEVPPGAHLGRASDGKRHYSICPPRGRARNYQFAVVAIPPSIRVAPKFSGLALLRGIVNANPPSHPGPGGLLIASYKRK